MADASVTVLDWTSREIRALRQARRMPVEEFADHLGATWKEWKTLLREAGVREARLHDARHTAATVLLLLGVPERAAMEFMGWSNSAMAKRYQHITGALRTDIANRLNGYLWT